MKMFAKILTQKFAFETIIESKFDAISQLKCRVRKAVLPFCFLVIHVLVCAVTINKFCIKWNGSLPSPLLDKLGEDEFSGDDSFL